MLGWIAGSALLVAGLGIDAANDGAGSRPQVEVVIGARATTDPWPATSATWFLSAARREVPEAAAATVEAAARRTIAGVDVHVAPGTNVLVVQAPDGRSVSSEELLAATEAAIEVFEAQQPEYIAAIVGAQ